MRNRNWAIGSLLGGVALGCTGMRTVEPTRFIPQYEPATVSVWTTRTKYTIVSRPQIEGDTLTGMVFDERWAMALKDIVRVEAVAHDPRRTALLVTGAAASVVGMAFVLANSTGRTSSLIPGLNCSSDYSSSTATGLTPCDAGAK